MLTEERDNLEIVRYMGLGQVATAREAIRLAAENARLAAEVERLRAEKARRGLHTDRRRREIERLAERVRLAHDLDDDGKGSGDAGLIADGWLPDEMSSDTRSSDHGGEGSWRSEMHGVG